MTTSSHDNQALTIGVLAVQGAFEAHAAVLRSLQVNAPLIRKPEELASLDGLVIPGGESTTFLKHLERNGFFEALQEFVRQKPSFGTCAGTILLAKDVRNPVQKSLAVLDATVERNAYGRQIDSTIIETESSLPGGPLETVYIRAPRIAAVGDGVEVLARRDGDPVLVREGKILAATFHPELSNDTRVHALFVEMVRQAKTGHTA